MKSIAEHLTEMTKTLNVDIVNELIVIYFEQIDESKLKFEALMTNPDKNEIIQLAHKMKSSARNLGAEQLAELLYSLEQNPQLFSGDTYKKVIDLFDCSKNSIEEWRRLNSG